MNGSLQQPTSGLLYLLGIKQVAWMNLSLFLLLVVFCLLAPQNQQLSGLVAEWF
jgi:hypothetical protein